MPTMMCPRLLRAGRQRISNLLQRLVYAPCLHPQAVAMDDPELYIGPADANRGRARLVSSLCSAQQLESNDFREWCRRLRDTFSLHRKLWEWGYICQALGERGMLASGKRGLGFAVGKEPLPSLFASMGCEILATDLDAADPRSASWSATHQLASTETELNMRGLCDQETFRRRVALRRVDMNRIPDDLQGFDFTWSSCSFEHCGSIELGQEFLCRQMKCLKSGGVAVHTTEFNLSSNRRTICEGETVIFRRRDLEQLARRLRGEGHFVEPFDLSLDANLHPGPGGRYSARSAGHLSVKLGPYLATSIGLIVRKQ